MNVQRQLNAFEKILLITGLGIGIVGFVFINFIFKADNNIMTWDMLTVVFLWLMLIMITIMCAIQENHREETAVVIGKHSEETRLLRKITEELHEEIKLMRIDLGYTHNKLLDSHAQLVDLHKAHTAKTAEKTTAKKVADKKASTKKKAKRR